MRRLINILFYIVCPWPLYVIFSYHFLSAGVRQCAVWGFIIAGMVLGMGALVVNWFRYAKKPGKRRFPIYPLVFSLIFAGYATSLVLTNFSL